MPRKWGWAWYGHGKSVKASVAYNECGRALALATISQSIAACRSSAFATMSLGGTVRATFQNVLKYFVTSALARLPRHVRFTPESGHGINSACPLCANSGHCALFDHLVGAREHRVRHTDSEHLSGLLIDDQLDFGCLQYW